MSEIQIIKHYRNKLQMGWTESRIITEVSKFYVFENQLRRVLKLILV